MKTKSFLVLGIIIIMHLSIKAQVKIGSNPTSINSNSLLELESGTGNQGFVLPRVSIGDVSAASPLTATMLTGTIVYNTNSATTGGSGAGIYYWDGSKWVFISTGSAVSSSAWLLTGNTGTNASTNFIGTTDAIDFVTRTANTERMRILGAANGSSKAGWIGMGITVPRSSLDVTGHYANKNVITIENSSTSGFSSVDMLDSAGNLAATFGYGNLGTGAFSGKAYFNGYGNDFLFTRGSSPDLLMKGTNGYVGINTTTPSERLHVVGNIYLNGAFMPGGTAGTLGYILTSAGAGVSPTWTSTNSLAWSLTGNSGTAYTSNFLGTTDNISMRFRTNNIQRMIIDSLGKVGIGISNPSYALSVLSASNPLYLSGVQATSTLSSDSVLTINGGVVKKSPFSAFTPVTTNTLSLSTNTLTSTVNGVAAAANTVSSVSNISSSNALTTIVNGVTGSGVSIVNSNTNSLSQSGGLVTTVNGIAATTSIPGGTVGNILGFNSSGSPVYQSLSNLSLSTAWNITGNSGTSFPSNFLGTTDNVSMRFRTNNVQRMIIDSLGNVGIGITNPAYALSVLSANNPLYLSGVQATSTLNTDSILTINGGVVKKTPSSAITGTTWLLTGNAGTNSAINFLGTTDNHPLKFKVNNSIAGFVDSSGGLGNSYFGNNAGYSNSTGSGNTFIGSGADSANSSGTSNTTLGYQAAYNNTSGGSNIFTGYQSGYSNTTASGNVFSGFQAGYRNTTGQLNTFSGYWTGYSNTTGSNNIFSGYLSGFGNTTGGNNIFIGSQAGSANTTGSRNTLIGGNSNVLAAGLANAAAFGYNAKVALSNSLVLGDTTSGGSAVNVGIGVRYPLKRLHIDAAPITSAGTQDSLKIDNLASSSSAYNKSVLVIDSITGYVSKQNLANLTSNINWSLTGNSGTSYASNFLGTTDNTSMRFRTNNVQRMIIDSLGSVGIGSSAFDATDREKLLVDYGTSATNTVATFKGSVDDYFQINLQNKSSTANASTDYVATADDGTDSTYYVDMGINSSGYAFSLDNWGQAHDAYLYSNSKNLYIGTQASNSDVIFLVGGGRAVTNAALRIKGSNGNIVVGKGEASSTPIGNTLRGPSGYGTNIAGGNLTITGGTGTGTAAGGNLYLGGGTTSTGSNGIINFSTANVERMRIDASGNVGIGTLNPSNTLSVLAASNPLYLSGVQATSTFTADSVLTINAGVVKKAPYSAISSATTNTLTLSTNTLTSSVNGVAATSNAVSGVSNNSSANTLSTTVNGITGTTVPIINSNTKTWSQSGGLTTTINGVSSNVTPASGTLNNILGYNVAGTPVYQSASGILSAATTNTLSLSGNTLTSTVNGVAATSSAVSSISNTSSANTLSTSVNGIAGTAVAIINTNTNALTQAGGLVTTVNGVAATTSIASGTVSNVLGYNASGTPVYQSLNNINLSTDWNLTGNAGTSYATNFLGTTDNVSMRFRTNNIQRMIIDSLGKVGIGTSSPASDLTLYQSSGSGSAKGFTFTGNSIGSTNSGTGFLMSLGYNTAGNKQLWLGDADYAGNVAGSFARFVTTGTVFPVIDAVSGDNALRRYLAFGVAGDVNSGVIFGGDNTSVNPGSQVWDNGNITIGAGYKSYAAPSNGLLVQGNVGIGTTASANALSVSAASNPLYLAGVQATSTFTADSILTINAGIVKKTPYSSLPTAVGGGWSLAGNSISSGQFLGTTNAQALVFKYNSINAGYLDANNTSLGTSSTATAGTSNTAIGYSSTAANSATAVGASANAANVANTAIGNNATANSSDHETAIGASTQATAQYNTALGYNAQAITNAYATAVGSNASATGYQSIALGVSTSASKDQTVAIGYNAQATGQYGIAIGNAASAATNTQTIAIGVSSLANAQYNTALGYSAQAISNTQATAIGSSSQANAIQATALGYNAKAISNGQTTALGSSSQANAQYSTALGYNAQAITNSQTTALGSSSQANAQYNTAVGYNAQSVTNSYGSAFGTNSNTTGQYSTAIGAETDATAQYATALGYNAQAVTNNQTTAVGANTIANSANATALGFNAKAQASNATAIGYNASTSQANALVLGDATSTVNVGIGTSTPNTNAKLDVAGSFKLGTAGTVLSSMIKSSVTITPTVNLGTTTTYTATVTGANTGASVIVNPRSALANGVVIAYSYISSANTITIAFTSGNTTGSLGAQTFDVTVIQ